MHCQDLENEGIAELLSPDNVSRTFPFLSIDEECVGSYESKNGGYLSPRQLVTAQKKIAKNHGVECLSSLVTSLDKDVRHGWIVTTADGQTLHCEKVVLCQGTYTGLSLLAGKYLPAPLDIWYTAQTVALIELDHDEAERLKTMPSMVTQTEPKQYTYILPPILYPDNKYYLKFGQHDLSKVLTNKSQVSAKYHRLLR